MGLIVGAVIAVVVLRERMSHGHLHPLKSGGTPERGTRTSHRPPASPPTHQILIHEGILVDALPVPT